MIKQHLKILVKQTNITEKSILATSKLLSEGATIPFISRYRKEMTGSLDEVQIAEIQQIINKLEELEKRKETILKSIEEQGKLSPELHTRIQNCYDATLLEDIYLPFKRKRKTKGMLAKERGLEPLAVLIWKQEKINLSSKTPAFFNDDILDEEDALAGARDIMAEWINEDETYRNLVRRAFKNHATIRSKVVKSKIEQAEKFKDYFEYEESLKHCPSHRFLAIKRGEDEGFLRMYIEPDQEDVIDKLIARLVKFVSNDSQEQIALAAAEAYKRLLQPSIETEFRNAAKEKADADAIQVFVDNLKQLLLAAPLGSLKTLALDPGYKSGCKLVALDANGDLLNETVIYPHPPQNKNYEAKETLKHWVQKYDIEAIAIGNGTAGKETMSLCDSIDFKKTVQIFMVNEAGASIYSASEVAREEFPEYDLTVRGAVSIGRRLMDPLAELVKLPPKSIGVGQYQHDVNQVKLKESLDRAVESCVNQVGININTASKHLLTYVSGLGPTLAANIVKHRTENGPFQSRTALKKVARMGEKAFEQSAGFLRIRDSKNPLDNTAVHPERYALVKEMAQNLNCKIQDIIQDRETRKTIPLKNYVSKEVGLPTLNDIIKELAKPGLDPRGEAKAFHFAADINSMEDLSVGIKVPGIVTNITNFGAFVDIGVKQDGLVHISELANKFVSNPSEIVKLQDQVEVTIIELDIRRKRIQLSMKR